MVFKTLVFCLLSISLSGIVVTEEEVVTPARLLIEKQILNKYLVESRDIVVNYNIFNVGQSAAVDVHIADSSFPAEHFDVVSGALKVTISRLAPGSNLTHTSVVRPKIGIWGRFNFTAAEVTYLPIEDSKDIQVAYTSEPGEGFIVSLKEFDRRFSPHVLDWAAFAIMTLPSLVIPFLLWYRSKSKYESIVSAKLANKKH
ncbi:translocon-associated protein subunit beta-like [Oppia nitens]|uniref:translocon-associated protein subunit beta-like n=1 Tax=Oppia nitens TaxID=1686743 RepID=UPI0023DA08FF|nr:translocon-associated protein subunit beta-like [Oppia nitens]